MNSISCSSCGETIEILEGGSEEAMICPRCEQSIGVSSANNSENGVRAGRTPYQMAPPGSDGNGSEAETIQRPKPFFQQMFRKTNPMDVSVIVTGLIGAALTTFLYLAVFPRMEGTYLGDLLTKRGWVQHAIVLLTTWSVAMLFQKYCNLARQAKAIKLDLLPRTISKSITSGNVSLFFHHLEGNAQDSPNSLIIKRILRTLKHFTARGQVKDAVDFLNTQNESDSNALESSFTMLKLCVWAIPLLGFIGTVVGIGQAVGGLSGSLQGEFNLDAMKNSIGVVTTGLGVAFDTTLLGLVMSIFIMFLTSSLQKSEEDFLSSVEDYCNEYLIGRLEDRKIGSMDGHVPLQRAIQEAITDEMFRHRTQLETVQKKLEEIGQLMTENIGKEWKKMQEELSKLQAQHIEALTTLNLKLVAQLGAGQRELTDRTIQTMGTIAEKVGTAQAQVIEQIQNQEVQIKQISNWTQRSDEQGVENIDLEIHLLERMRKSLLAKKGFKG